MRSTLMTPTRAQQARLLSGGGNADVVREFQAWRQEMAAERRRERANQPAQIERIVKATIQTAGGRR